jgi:Protein of unknown function (DUF2891)
MPACAAASSTAASERSSVYFVGGFLNSWSLLACSMACSPSWVFIVVGPQRLMRVMGIEAVHPRPRTTKQDPEHRVFPYLLREAELMRRVLRPDEFASWLDRFLPGLGDGSAKRLLAPVEVSDVADPKLVHLAGLNLSRAWALAGIARGLPVRDLRVKRLEEAAAKHAEKGLGYVFSGHYEGEHWLATFAIYALSDVGTNSRSSPAR